jgi:APA family basic amino acid/polyamine antiporter
VAAAGVLLSLLAGISRTAFAMAAEGDLPRALAAVHPRFAVPHRAELAAAAAICALVLVADLRGAIGFSSFAVLTYYGIANASALTLGPSERRWPRGLAVAGIVACAALALSLPAAAVLGGLTVLAAGALLYALRRRTG